MDPRPRVELERLAREDPAVLEDARRVRALLQDLCPAHRLENSLLVAAIEEGVPGALRRAPSSVPIVAEVERLARQLAGSRGLDRGASRWSVGALAWIVDRADPPDDNAGADAPVMRQATPPLPAADAFETMTPEQYDPGRQENEPVAASPHSAPTGPGDSRRKLVLLTAVVPLLVIAGLLAIWDAPGPSGDPDGLEDLQVTEEPTPADPLETAVPEEQATDGSDEEEENPDPSTQDGTEAPSGAADDEGSAATGADPSPSGTSARGDVPSLPAGYFCRDLNALGYDYAEAVWYWDLEGQPERMDAAQNGTPCQTVYRAHEVAAYWGYREDMTNIEPGLFCRDLAARAYTYEEAVWYWRAEGQPARMDAAGNGIPCQTVYSADEVRQYWGR